MLDWISSHPWLPIALVAFGIVLGTVAYLILLERKVASWTQDRLGPNRVGPGGMLQPIADGLKMLFKEDYRPAGVDRRLFSFAPGLMMAVVVISIAVVPWGGTVQSKKTIRIPPAVANVQAEIGRHIPAGAVVERTTINQVPPGLDVRGRPYEGYTEAIIAYRWNFQIANLNIGVLFILAILSLAVYGVVVGGWASNNKYSFIGGLRACAQMISYEIPLGLSILTIVVMFGTLDLNQIVSRQVHYWGGWLPAWNVFCQPVAFLLFLVCIHAEANRAPFDLAEAEQELIGGYHTEYTSMRLGLLLLAEYAGMITTSAVCTALFFGGWHIPWLDKIWPALSGAIDPADPSVTTSIGISLLRSLVFFVKTLLVIFVFMWVRWSLPRFRFDQLMRLAWSAMIPISLALLLLTGLVIFFAGQGSHRFAMRVGGWMALWLFIANLVLIVGSSIVSLLLPAGPAINRRIAVPGSRFTSTPLPAEA